MKTRKINITIEIEDNDLIEFNLHNFLHKNLGTSIIDYTKLSDTKWLYDNDSHFKKLTKAYYEAKKTRNDYINEHNFKQD